MFRTKNIGGLRVKRIQFLHSYMKVKFLHFFCYFKIDIFLSFVDTTKSTHLIERDFESYNLHSRVISK